MKLRFAAALIFATMLGMGTTSAPVHAYGRADQHTANWNRHDTAAYVVSTLNLLRTPRGKALAGIWIQRHVVSRFEVYADAVQDTLYFIQLRRSDGSLVATLAYQMGWPKPRTLGPGLGRYHIASAPDSVLQSFQSDARTLLGTFASSFPV